MFQDKHRTAGCSVTLGITILLLCVVGGGCSETERHNVATTKKARTVATGPLTQSERDQIYKRVSWQSPDGGGLGEEGAVKLVEEFEGRPMVPFLIGLAENNEEPAHVRTGAMWVLGKSRDARAIPAIRNIIDQPLNANMTRDEWHLLHGAILCLGMCADDATLDLLFDMAREDYWLARNPQAAEKGRDPKSFRNHMRLMALNGIALSGSQRAIEAFETKQGIPLDLRRECDWLLKAARMRSQGIYRVSDYEGP